MGVCGIGILTGVWSGYRVFRGRIGELEDWGVWGEGSRFLEREGGV